MVVATLPRCCNCVSASSDGNSGRPSGEDGVAPGQACVLYDGPAGAARVLGGGFIRRRQDLRPAAAHTTLQATI